MSTSDYQTLVASTALASGLDPVLALAVAQQESGFNPSAVSPAGAIGIMQLMPATAADLGVNPNNPTQNVQGGITLLNQLMARYGDQATALAAYNWGSGNVDRAMQQYGADWLSHAPAETRDYVARILGSVGSAGPAQLIAEDSGIPFDAAGNIISGAIGGSPESIVGVVMVLAIAAGITWAVVKA